MHCMAFDVATKSTFPKTFADRSVVLRQNALTQKADAAPLHVAFFPFQYSINARYATFRKLH